MKMTATEKGGKLIISLAGELDHHEARMLSRQIEERIEVIMPRDCILDLSGIRFMDSSGIAVILKTYKRMMELDGRLFVENVPEQPMRVLDASGIDRLVGITAQM